MTGKSTSSSSLDSLLVGFNSDSPVNDLFAGFIRRIADNECQHAGILSVFNQNELDTDFYMFGLSQTQLMSDVIQENIDADMTHKTILDLPNFITERYESLYNCKYGSREWLSNIISDTELEQLSNQDFRFLGTSSLEALLVERSLAETIGQ